MGVASTRGLHGMGAARTRGLHGMGVASYHESLRVCVCVGEGPVTRGLHGMGVASYHESLRVCMCVWGRDQLPGVSMGWVWPVTMSLLGCACVCVGEGPVTRGLHGMGVASYHESLRVCMCVWGRDQLPGVSMGWVWPVTMSLLGCACVCGGGTSYQGSPWGMPFLWPSKSLSVSACCS